MGGKAGNKGGVALRFTVADVSYCLVNCHLESGPKKKKERTQ